MKQQLVLALIALALVSCHPDGDDEVATAQEIAEMQQRFEASCGKRAVTCLKQTDVTEGPYYFQTGYLRKNITEGKAGVNLLLQITIVDVNTCNVVPDAAVDVWHCDATGLYSHFYVQNNYADPNSTFLRGNQFTDSTGVASFISIVPAFYTGRATHIHFKVHINGTTVNGAYSGGYVSHTGQLYFNDTFLDGFYSDSSVKATGYSYQGTRITLANDNIYLGANYGIMDVSYVDSSLGYVGGLIASITIGVNSTTTESSSAGSGATGSVPSTNGPPSGTSTSTAISSTSTSTTVVSSTSTSSTSAVEQTSTGSLMYTFSYLLSAAAVMFTL